MKGYATTEKEGYDYDPDCPACLRHLPHTADAHQEALRRNYVESLPDCQDHDDDSMW